MDYVLCSQKCGEYGVSHLDLLSNNYYRTGGERERKKKRERKGVERDREID